MCLCQEVGPSEGPLGEQSSPKWNQCSQRPNKAPQKEDFHQNPTLLAPDPELPISRTMKSKFHRLKATWSIFCYSRQNGLTQSPSQQGPINFLGFVSLNFYPSKEHLLLNLLAVSGMKSVNICSNGCQCLNVLQSSNLVKILFII